MPQVPVVAAEFLGHQFGNFGLRPVGQFGVGVPGRNECLAQARRVGRQIGDKRNRLARPWR